MAKNPQAFLKDLEQRIHVLKQKGLYKSERIITTPQRAEITTDEKQVICLCANNYLGLADNTQIVNTAIDHLSQGNYGMASVRFICGTQAVHTTLEKRLSTFLGMEATLLYSSCFDANGGLFEALLSSEDAVISDALNHASIIDGIRLCKAQRYRYNNNDMADLEANLKQADRNGARYKLIATDGVFSMDGYIANLQAICDLADQYNAMVMIDDSHAVGFVGQNGKGTHEYCKVMDRVDIITGTLGKALGGASGGYTSGKKQIIEWLRQRSRPYLFSNTLTPALAAATLKALELIENGTDRRKKLKENTLYFRKKMTALGFTLLKGDHPIIPVMIGEAALATKMANKLLEEGVYVIGFSFPVVPMGQARIRTQMNAKLTQTQLDKAISCFEKVGKNLNII